MWEDCYEIVKTECCRLAVLLDVQEVLSMCHQINNIQFIILYKPRF